MRSEIVTILNDKTQYEKVFHEQKRQNFIWNDIGWYMKIQGDTIKHDKTR